MMDESLGNGYSQSSLRRPGELRGLELLSERWAVVRVQHQRTGRMESAAVYRLSSKTNRPGEPLCVWTGGVEEVWEMRTVGSGYSGAVSRRCHMLYLREAQTVRSL
jgi:hypothetical protein